MTLKVSETMSPKPEDQMPKLTIITPVFNGKPFIADCLQVVIDQNCPAVEHIVVDGASTDGTVEVVQEYARRYRHIRWISEKDRGQSDAMNKGIRAARGSIISFLNVDDFYEPNVLNRVLQVFEELDEPAFVVGNCRILNEDGGLIELNRPRNLGILDLLMGWEANRIPANPSAYFYHKSLHEKIGMYDVDQHYTLDVDFLMRAVQGARVLKHVDEVWGNFRFIPGAKTYADCKAGRNWERYYKVLDHYQERLSPLQKVRLFAKCWCWRANRRLRRFVKSILLAVGLRTA